MLPVQAIDYTPPIAVMLVIDCSGARSSGRCEAALRGAEECLDSLTERDYCGVMGFSTSSTEHVSVMPVSQKETIRTAIKKVEALVAEGKKEEATAALNAAISLLDKNSQKGIISVNSANRKKAHLQHAVAALA